MPLYFSSKGHKEILRSPDSFFFMLSWISRIFFQPLKYQSLFATTIPSKLADLESLKNNTEKKSEEMLNHHNEIYHSIKHKKKILIFFFNA